MKKSVVSLMFAILFLICGCNHAPDAFNMELTGVPTETHSNFPHHWPTICVTLKTIVSHQAPANQTEACQGLIQP